MVSCARLVLLALIVALRPSSLESQGGTFTALVSNPYNANDGRENPDASVERVTRGGGQDSGANQITTTYRGQGLSREPQGGHHNIGFRCAR